jgi:hypothetical protein
MHPDRRSVLAALGVGLPFAAAHAAPASAPAGPPPVVRFRSFEDAVREAFAAGRRGDEFPCCRVEVGHSEALTAGLPGCHNDRPFAGFPAGHLRIVRAGCEPGPAVGGVRLYVATVDVVLTGGRELGRPSRPLDFATLPPAAVLIALELEAARQSTEPTHSAPPGA